MAPESCAGADPSASAGSAARPPPAPSHNPPGGSASGADAAPEPTSVFFFVCAAVVGVFENTHVWPELFKADGDGAAAIYGTCLVEVENGRCSLGVAVRFGTEGQKSRPAF